MATESSVSTESRTESRLETDRGSRTVFHILASAVIAGILIGILSFFTFYSNFFHQRQVKAIQAGAQVDLDLVARSEKTFHEKHGAYTTDLAALGIAPKKVVYKFGFVQPSDSIAGVEGLDPSRKDLDALKKANPKLEIGYSPVTKLDSIDFGKLASYCQDCTAGKDTFKAIAAANLDEDPELDVWTIDEKGNVTHLVNDL